MATRMALDLGIHEVLLTFMTTSHVLTELVGVGDLRVIRSCCTHAFILLEHFCVSNAYILYPALHF